MTRMEVAFQYSEIAFFKESFILAGGNRFSINYKILTRMEVAFRYSEVAFFKEPFILASGKGFLINYKLRAFIWSSFLLVDAMLEIRRKQFSSGFFISNSGSSFSG